MPALFTKICNACPEPTNPFAKASMEKGSIRSSVSTITPDMAASALLALERSRAGTTTLAPAERRIRRALKPYARIASCNNGSLLG
jgi:hypothetical protein